MNPLSAFRTYGFHGLVRLILDLMWTKVTYPQARILRRPVYIRGAARIRIGRGFTSGPGLRIDAIEPNGSVVIGRDVQVNNNVHIGAYSTVTIGDRVLVAGGVFIADHNHGAYAGASQSSPLTPPADRVLQGAPVRIGDDVWLGEHVCVLAGVEIGRGVVVGAGAVVTKNLPEFTLAVGSPARVVKRFDFESMTWLPSR
jgi:lipopolysaccharide O-acetyltransferase